MADDTIDQNFSYPCAECQAGMRHLKHVTYYTWLTEDLITVPNFPAWVCDVCGRVDYDIRAMSWVDTILNLPRHSRRKGRASRRVSRPGSPTTAFEGR